MSQITPDHIEQTRKRLMEAFGEPDLITGAGNPWFIIRTAEQADLAQKLSQTAIGNIWMGTRKDAPLGDSHEWLIMVQDGRAEVAMAAKIEGRDSMHENRIADCHITGHRNSNPFPKYEEDIRIACATLSLAYVPNHMGRPIDMDDDGPSL